MHNRDKLSKNTSPLNIALAGPYSHRRFDNLDPSAQRFVTKIGWDIGHLVIKLSMRVHLCMQVGDCFSSTTFRNKNEYYGDTRGGKEAEGHAMECKV